MIDKVKTYIDREIGLSPEAFILVALSGGADSTALLLILKEWVTRFMPCIATFI